MTEGLRTSSGVAVLVLFATVAAAQISHGPVEVKIDSVLAADTNQGCDKQLSTLRGRLMRLFHYSTYRLVRHEEGHTGFGQTVTFSLPGGRILHIQPMGMDGGMIRMEIMLFQGEQPMMTTDLKIMNGGVFMVGGPRYDEGTLIISIKPLAPQSAEVVAPATELGPPSAMSPPVAVAPPPALPAPPPAVPAAGH
jgi:hypothetical protein